MPAKVKVRILAGRNLPVMDKSSDASDAFVEVKLGNTTYKTEVYRRSLNPFWNSEWFRFEVSDQELQDEPLQIRIMDYDTYSANDAIGKVYINLNPLLINPGRSMSGWLPIYDTLHGIRGEINCMVKVNLFADNNRYRHSSCGVRFFFSDIPNGYKCDAILGFVDELLVNDDPEYQWIDKIRTPRASNEARQTLFTKLSGEVQRKLGLKAEVFGGNAVIGYQQSFDLEGSSGIVGRGIGTAVVLSKIGSPYEGIISPVSMGDQNAPHPYFFDGYRRNNRHDRSNRSYYGPKTNYTDRQLVHSISADYFYEVPSGASITTKRLSTNLETPTNLSKQLTRSGTTISDTLSDESEYEDCEETLSQHTDASSEEDNESNDRSGSLKLKSSLSFLNQSSSEKRRKKKLFRRLAPNLLTRSIVADTKEMFNRLPFQTLPVSTIADTSTDKTAGSRTKNSLLKRILQSNEIITQTVTKPITTSSTKLTKLLSLRRPHLQTHILNDNQSKQLQQDIGAPSLTAGGLAEAGTSKLLTSPTKTSGVDESNQQSTDGEANQRQSPSSSNGSSAIILKRRRDKSQSASLEDALSIIEEKLDDDETMRDNLDPIVATTSSSLAAPTTTRPRSSSASAKSRPMLRAKEIDLNDDEGMEDISAASAANGDEIEIEDFSSSAADAKLVASESVLSSSSPSTSVLTDETVRAREFSPPSTPQYNKPKFLSQLSSPREKTEAQHPTMHRSDTDLTMATDESTTTPTAAKASSTKTSSSSSQIDQGATRMLSSSPDFRQKAKDGQQNPGAGNNFAQSVRTVRAQQHLLQNMIRHQNQNLVYSSTSKAKNAFMYPNRVHQSEYPFVTLKKYPSNAIQCTGGVVSVHSVKLLDHIINDEESETRDVWWTEIRKEIRSHAKALNCNTILGYSETSKVIGDVCVLSACGTAAILRSADQLASSEPSSSSSGQTGVGGQIVNTSSRSPTGLKPTTQTLKVPRLSASPPPSHSSMPPSSSSQNGNNNADSNSKESQQPPPPPASAQSALSDHHQHHPVNSKLSQEAAAAARQTGSKIDCSFCHTSLACVESVASLANCTICGLSKVPDVLLLTIEPPQNLNIVSAVSLVQARVCRAKRDAHGEANAREIGEALPFLEYELHRQLLTKLKFKGMNCLFDLSVDISVGENMITGLATGTGCFVLGLPEPEPPQISAGKGIKTSKLNEIQQLISLSAIRNREILGLSQIKARLARYHAETAQDSCSSNSMLKLQTGSHQDGDQMVGSNETLKNQELPANENAEGLSFESAQNNRTKPKSSISSEYYLPSNRPSNKHNHAGHHNHHHHRHQQHRHQRSPISVDTTTDNLLNLLTDDNNIVLEVDDSEDADIIAQLIDNDTPKGYLICNCESLPTINQSSITSINMFTQVVRVKLTGLEQFSQQFEWILQALFVKLRRSLPCCLTNINFVVDLPETNVVQISVTGCLLGLSSSPDLLDLHCLDDTGNGDPTDALQQQLLEERSTLNQVESSQLLRQLKANNQRQQLSTTSTSMSPNSITTSSSSSSLTSTPSTTTPAPSSSSSSSSGSSSSPASSVSSKHSSSQKSQSQATKKRKESGKASETIAKSITRQLSKTNIAALISGKKKSPSREDSNMNIELPVRSHTGEVAETMTALETQATRAAVVAAMKDSQQRQTSIAIRATTSAAANQQQPEQTGTAASRTAMIRSMRAVFKKQQTYPGATSPQISGQDRLLPANEKGSAQLIGGVAASNSIATPSITTTTDAQSTPGSAAARRATNILNKVKQPLKDLGSNFNTNANQATSSSAAVSQLNGQPSPSATPTTAGSSSHATGPGQRSKIMSLGHHRSSSARVSKTTTSRSATTKSPSSTAAHLATSASSHVIGAGGVGQDSTMVVAPSALGAAAQKAMQTITATVAAASTVPANNQKKLSESSSINSSIDITSLSYIPGAREYHYLGNLSFSFVRETNSVRENGGLNGFIHCFLMEVYAIVRAHVSALGGNAFLSFRLQQSCIFYHSNKNQAQCLISVAGDAVQVAL